MMAADRWIAAAGFAVLAALWTAAAGVGAAAWIIYAATIAALGLAAWPERRWGTANAVHSARRPTETRP